MSLILDALNRSRTEQDAVPTLVTRHGYVEEKPSRKSLFLVVTLLLAIAVIAWLLWERTAAVDPVATVIPAMPAATVTKDSAPAMPAARPAPDPLASVSPPEPEPVPDSAEVSHLSSVAEPLVEPPAGTDSASEDISSLYRKRPAESQAKAQVVAPEAPVVASEQSLEETGVDIEQLLRKAEDELENARLAEHPAPFIVDLSQQTKDAIPSIIYQRHEYSGRPGESVVVLNGKTLKAGGSPASGVTVEEILPDSVVLDYRGTEFRLRALNSWVNL